MTKPTFTLESHTFSDSDTETPISGTIAAQYNRQYSIIYQQIKTFLKQCKENINKYIQLNQFGARFNMFALYAQMTTMETATLTGLSDVSKQQLQHQKNLKITYEKEFENILGRMESVIRDFLKFQIDFKREYFGINIKEAEVMASKKRPPKKLVKSSIFEKLSRQNSIQSGSSARHRSSRTFIEEQSEEKKENEQKESELEQKLREILKRKLAPQKQKIIKFCDKDCDPFKNMLKLEQKIDMMQSEMILSKTREEKIIEIFNKRRIENIQPKGHGLVHSQLIDTGSGNGMNGKNLALRAQLVQSQIRQSSDDVKRKGIKFVKPSLNMEIVNDSKQQAKGLTPRGGKQTTPRHLISPRVIRSPTSKNLNEINFLGSPKGIMGFRFKKKREEQLVQKRENGQDGGVNKNISQMTNKNREQFLKRRRSNNQSFRVGVEAFVE